jgi:hypothetical protein
LNLWQKWPPLDVVVTVCEVLIKKSNLYRMVRCRLISSPEEYRSRSLRLRHHLFSPRLDPHRRGL